jgi:hypothetical protein
MSGNSTPLSGSATAAVVPICPFSHHSFTKVYFPTAARFRDADLMPPIVVIALYVSIVLVLGILVWWEFKRVMKRRRIKFPLNF